MTPELAEAVERLVAETGRSRYRELCDPDHPDYSPDHATWALSRAGTPTAAPKARVGLARRLQMVTCLYRDRGCHCDAPVCHWKGRAVTLAECHSCHP